MQLADRVKIITACREKGKTKEVLIRLSNKRDLWELQSLALEAIGSHPNVVTIDPGGLGIVEYFDPHVLERGVQV